MKHTLLFFAIVLIFSDLNSQTYFLTGNATYLGGDCYQLTPDFNTQVGTVWYGDQIDLLESFDISFTMNFGFSDAGADGICFVMQNVGTAATGTSGGGMGYGDFGTSLGIEFDTYQNGDYGDPFYDHIAIEINGDINHNSINNIAGPVEAQELGNNIEDGEDHIVRVTWDPETQLISVYFDCVFRVSGEIDIINTIFSGVSQVYWGFTAATGGAVNYQTVCLQENIVTASEDILICNGATTTISTDASFDGVYTWTPSDYLSNTDQQTVDANPPVTTTYTVEFLDICGDLNTLEYNVIVEPLEITLSGLQTITCQNPLSEVMAEINFEGNVTFTWVMEGDIVLSGQNASYLELPEPGTGEIIAGYQNVCFDTLSFEIEADLDPYLAVAGNDVVLNCYDPSAEITGDSDGDDAEGYWTVDGVPFSQGFTFTATEEGTYVLIVVNPSNGCISEDEMNITEDFDEPSVEASLQDTLSCLQPEITISGIDPGTNNNYEISWTTEDGNIVSGPGSIAPGVNAQGFYEFTVTDLENGCEAGSGVFVEENEELSFDLAGLLFPNIFTPNGDDDNGEWQPFLRDDPQKDISFIFEQFDLKIYNRWGKVIFETTSADRHWAGAEMSEGVYFYHVQYKAFCDDGSTRVKEGYIHLAR